MTNGWVDVQIPIIAFCGHGRSGKDTGAEWARDHTILRFKGGCSWTALKYMAKRLSEDEGRVVTEEEAYKNRHMDRMKWYTYMNQYREGDPSRLIRDCLEHSDIVCGVRDGKELTASKEKGLLDLIIWVNRDVPNDPTVTYTRDDCDIVVDNTSTLEAYYQKLARLMKSLGLQVKE